MHEGVDFLYEAVANSLEAECKNISVLYYDNEDEVKVSVKDDGQGKIGNMVFDEGFSLKEGHSGRGLYLLKQRCGGNVDIVREKGWTELKYIMKKDENFGKLKSILPLLFARLKNDQDLVFEYIKNGKSQLIYSKDYRFFDSTETILKIRNIVQNWD